MPRSVLLHHLFFIPVLILWEPPSAERANITRWNVATHPKASKGVLALSGGGLRLGGLGLASLQGFKSLRAVYHNRTKSGNSV